VPNRNFCIHKGMIIQNLADVPSKDACELCQCVEGNVRCAKQECQGPPTENCRALPTEKGECCPRFDCSEIETSSESDFIKTTSSSEILDDDTDDYTEDNAGGEIEDDDNTPLPTSSMAPLEESPITSPKPVATTQLTTLLTSSMAQDGAITTVTPASIQQNEDGTFGTASGDILDGAEYEDIDFESLSPGACLFDNKIYVSAQQIPRDNPCDFCFCFRGDIICLQQSCPPPIAGCTEEIIPGFCCPRYECPVKMSIHNVTRHIQHTTETPSLASWFGFGGEEPVEDETYQTEVKGCEVKGNFYETGTLVDVSSGPCLQCICDNDEKIDCEPTECETQPLLKRMLKIR